MKYLALYNIISKCFHQNIEIQTSLITANLLLSIYLGTTVDTGTTRELSIHTTKITQEQPAVMTELSLYQSKNVFIELFPVYVGGAVFASALPPRNEAALNAEQQAQLRKLLQSKNPDDLQKANKVTNFGKQGNHQICLMEQ